MKDLNKPCISILMATYYPNPEWFAQQLQSINAQTYSNLNLYVLDDASSEESFRKTVTAIENNITTMPYRIERNDKNCGSTKTFQRLAELADGQLFAFCDQDDIWHADKLEKCEQALKQSEALLVCSDLNIINESGRLVADSICKVRPRHVFHSGANLAPGLMYKNFVAGCTILCAAETVRKALPFAENLLHDQWLALYCAAHGEIYSIPEPLIDYRLHGNNQTAVMSGVHTKQDYFERRIEPFQRQMDEIVQRLEIPQAEGALQWARARCASYHREKGAIRELWKLRHQNVSTTYFELLALHAPQPLFRLAVWMIQQGKI